MIHVFPVHASRVFILYMFSHVYKNIGGAWTLIFSEWDVQLCAFQEFTFYLNGSENGSPYHRRASACAVNTEPLSTCISSTCFSSRPGPPPQTAWLKRYSTPSCHKAFLRCFEHKLFSNVLKNIDSVLQSQEPTCELSNYKHEHYLGGGWHTLTHQTFPIQD